MSRRLGLACAAALLLGACAADQQWRKANTTENEWRRDSAACRDKAKAQVRHEEDRNILSLGETSFSPGYYGRSRLGGQDTLTRRLTEYQARQRRHALTDECLRRQGYEPVADAE